MILQAAEFLIRQDPANQERWEHNSGYSPSTIAAMIAALICAACIACDRQNPLFLTKRESIALFELW